MKLFKRVSITMAAGLILVCGHAAHAIGYAGGSVIIPTQSSYQDNCGVASAYGLVYNVLRANDGLAAIGKSRITVHWAYKSTKASPNRCVPTDIQNPPVYGSYTTSNPPPWYDAIWNDGCDFRVTSNASVPVKLVKNSTGLAADDTNITTINTTADPNVYPNYGSVTIQQTTNPKVTSVGYLGGPFVIAASDANTFLQLLSGSLVVQDKNGNNVDFTAYRTPVACSGATNGFGGTAPGHYVNVHRALVAFSADDNLTFNSPPPRVALQDQGGAVSTGTLDPYMTNAGLKFTGAFGCPPGGQIASIPSLKTQFCPTGQQGLIFDYFSTLDFTNGLMFATDANGNPLYQAIWTPHWGIGGPGVTASFPTPPTGLTLKTTSASPGLPAGTYYYRITAANPLFGETLASTEVSITTTKTSGIALSWSILTNNGNNAYWYKIYGRTKGAEQYIDRVQGLLSYTDTGATSPSGPLPTSNTTGPPGPPDIVAALKNISTFLNGKTGLFAQCASIETYEGETGTDNYPAAQSVPPIQFQTCLKSSSNPGACSTTAPQYGITKNIAGSPSDQTSIGSYLQNCTDPTATSGAACEYFPNPGDGFLQIGDHKWYSQFGMVANYVPATGNIYKPGTLNLAYNVKSLDKTKLTSPTTARTMMLSDEVTRSNYNSNPGLANIVYLAGHTYDKYLAGNRLVLGTLLQLGIVYQSVETGYVGPTLYNDSVFVPTYGRVTSAPTSNSVKKFDPMAGSQFLFPYHKGWLKTHSLSSGLQDGNNAFSDAVQWNASDNSVMRAPNARNVFTYLGGQITLGSNQIAKQSGWTPVDFDYTSIQSPLVNCVDKLHVGPVAANTSLNKPGPYTGMVAGSNGVCDLEEALANTLSLTASDFGSDNGASEQAAIKTKLLSTSVNDAVQVTQQLTQLVRGFCFATVGGSDGSGAAVFNPTSSQCNPKGQDNVIDLGGFVHSQAAVIAASPYIMDAPSGKRRPTVAYLGGLDGQVHAFYVPGPDTKDAGYTGPANPLNLPFASAKATFHTDDTGGGAGFARPAALTELWSFIPPGQLPYLYSNDAMVDSSPAVLDIFADLDGDGLREWHTVLVASAGGHNRELFALDVTNPLAPALLWDIQSSFDSTSLAYAPAVLADDDTGKALVAGQESFQWQNHCRAADVSASTCKATNYNLPPLSDAGRSTSGKFNYVHLGASQSVQAALLRRDNAPVFAAFTATNEPGGNGMYVFAIDIATGAKLWEFNNPYDPASDASGMADGLDNTPPAGVTLFSKANTSLIDSVYTGDLEGSLWELDAVDGLSQTSYASQIGSSCTAAGSCNFALSNAFGYDPNGYPQPITTLSTIFTVPQVSSTSWLSNYAGQTLLAYGTAGTDKVSSLSYTVTGSVHLLPLAASGRLSSGQVIGPPSQFSLASSKGLGKEITGYPQYVSSGERLYGSITAAGDHLFFATTSGSVTNIDSRGSLGGSTYNVDMTTGFSSSRTALATNAGGAGGTVLVATNNSGQTKVITVTDQTINISSPSGTLKLTAPSINGVGQTSTGLLGWFLRSSGHEY